MFGRSRKECKEWRNNSDENDRIRSYDGHCRVDDGCVAGGHQEGADEVARDSSVRRFEVGTRQADSFKTITREASAWQADGFKAITREAITRQADCIQARASCEAGTR